MRWHVMARLVKTAFQHALRNNLRWRGWPRFGDMCIRSVYSRCSTAALTGRTARESPQPRWGGDPFEPHRPRRKRLDALVGEERRRSYCGRTADAFEIRFDAERRRWPVKAAAGSLRGLPPTPHTDAKLRQECPDALVDFVSYRSNSFQRLARGIRQKPFLVAASGEDRAHVATAHGDHYVSGFEHVVSPAFRLLSGDVDTLFCHRGDGCWVYLIGGFGAARVDRCLIPGVVGEEPHGHLGAAGVVGVKEEHSGFRHDVLSLAVRIRA